MKNKLVFFTGLLVLCSLSGGCIFLVASSVGALGGYAVSQDTIQGETNKSFSAIWNSSLKVLRIMGTIKTEDKLKGIIEAKVDASDVVVKIEALTPKFVRLRVSARKYLLPNITLSQKIYIKIIEHSE